MPRSRVPAPPIPDHVPLPTLSPSEAAIPLYRMVGGSRRWTGTARYAIVAYTILDQADHEMFSPFRWSGKWTPGTRSYYARRFEEVDGKRVTIFLHREILGLPRNPGRAFLGEQVDHINHDTLDNRRSNLRVTDHAGNNGNQRRHRDATRRFRGTYPSANGWRTEFRHRGKQYPFPVLHGPQAEVYCALLYNYAVEMLRDAHAQKNDIPTAELPPPDAQRKLRRIAEAKLRAKGLIP